MKLIETRDGWSFYQCDGAVVIRDSFGVSRLEVFESAVFPTSTQSQTIGIPWSIIDHARKLRQEFPIVVSVNFSQDFFRDLNVDEASFKKAIADTAKRLNPAVNRGLDIQFHTHTQLPKGTYRVSCYHEFKPAASAIELIVIRGIETGIEAARALNDEVQRIMRRRIDDLWSNTWRFGTLP